MSVINLVAQWLRNIMGVKEICICAAIKLPDGKIIRGQRHADCFRVAVRKKLEVKGRVEGFITSTNRFVNRKEGYLLQTRAHIKSVARNGYFGKELYSEDLY